MNKRILGIDPGSNITGFGVIEVDARQINYVDCGCLRLKGDTMPKKLGNLLNQLESVIDQHKPTEVAVEAIFLHINADSALKLGQARGVVLALVITKLLPIFEYAAKQVKLAVTGKGGADKIQVQYMVSQMLKLNNNLQADAADALAIALCHAHVQSTWGGILGEQGVVAFSRKKKSSRRHYRWPSYLKNTDKDNS